MHNVAYMYDRPRKNLLCTMLHAEAIITVENEPNVHVLPIILFNYLEPSIQDGTKF